MISAMDFNSFMSLQYMGHMASKIKGPWSVCAITVFGFWKRAGMFSVSKFEAVLGLMGIFGSFQQLAYNSMNCYSRSFLTIP